MEKKHKIIIAVSIIVMIAVAAIYYYTVRKKASELEKTKSIVQPPEVKAPIKPKYSTPPLAAEISEVNAGRSVLIKE